MIPEYTAKLREYEGEYLRPKILLLLVPVVFIIGLPVLRYVLDPLKLRRFPAPSWTAATTRLWCAINSYRGRRYLAIDEAHNKLGPIVRISSSHLSFNDVSAVKEIYSHQNGSGILKDQFYDNLAGQFHNIANVRERNDHARKRRYFSNALALKTVVEMETIIQQHLSSLMERLDSAGSQSIDMNKWLNYFTFDVISHAAVGQSFYFLRNGCDSAVGQRGTWPKLSQRPVSSVIDSLHSAFHFKVALGQLSRNWYLALSKVLSWTKGRESLDQFTSVAVDQVKGRLERGCKQQPVDLFERILSDRDGNTPELPFMELVSEAIVLLNAGSDTTASGLTSIVYELARNKNIQRALQAELDDALGPVDESTPASGLASFDAVKRLPYLQACLDENLRMNPPIPYGPPRVVIDPKGIKVSGHHILPGTTVSVPTHTIQRHPDHFYPDSCTFRPERWIEEPPAGTSKERMQKAFVPFSVGPRSCLGRNLAMMEQQVLMATLFHRYDISLADPDFELSKFEAFNIDPGCLPVTLRRRSS